MKKILFLLVIAIVAISCNKKLEIKDIKKLDNVYANNNIIRYTVLGYKYQSGVLDSLNVDTVSVADYGIRGNLKSFRNKVTKEEQQYIFKKGTDPVGSDVYNLSNGGLSKKIKYSYDKDKLTENVFDAQDQLIEKYIYHKDASGKDTLTEKYSKENKLVEKTSNVFDNVGLKLMKHTNLEQANQNFTCERVGDDKTKRVIVENDYLGKKKTEATQIYDDKGRLVEETRVVFDGEVTSVNNHSKYFYAGEDELLDKVVFYQEDGTPLFEQRYVYDTY